MRCLRLDFRRSLIAPSPNYNSIACLLATNKKLWVGKILFRSLQASAKKSNRTLPLDPAMLALSIW
jgi:hypothetical protein